MLEPKPQFQWRKTTISVKKNHNFLWRKITISEEEIDSWYWGKINQYRRLFMSWQAGSSRTAQVSGLTNGCHLLWLLSAAAILFKHYNIVVCTVCTVQYWHLLWCNTTCKIHCVLLSAIYSVTVCLYFHLCQLCWLCCAVISFALLSSVCWLYQNNFRVLASYQNNFRNRTCKVLLKC